MNHDRFFNLKLNIEIIGPYDYRNCDLRYSKMIGDALDDLLQDIDFRQGAVGINSWEFKTQDMPGIVRITQWYDGMETVQLIQHLGKVSRFKNMVARSLIKLAIWFTED